MHQLQTLTSLLWWYTRTLAHLQERCHFFKQIMGHWMWCLSKNPWGPWRISQVLAIFLFLNGLLSFFLFVCGYPIPVQSRPFRVKHPVKYLPNNPSTNAQFWKQYCSVRKGTIFGALNWSCSSYYAKADLQGVKNNCFSL